MNEEIVCFCSNVSKQEIIEAIKNGAKTLEDIRLKTNACTLGKCKELSPRKKCCSGEIMKMLSENSYNV